MMDLDELKAINDRMGHFHGDRVLREVGRIVADGVRRIDTAARYGGDEFVVLLPETDPTGAFVLAEKMRIGVMEAPLELPEPSIRPSLSVGVVGYPGDGSTADELMISADAAMYASKRARQEPGDRRGSDGSGGDRRGTDRGGHQDHGEAETAKATADAAPPAEPAPRQPAGTPR